VKLTIDSISPVSGPAGTAVLIYGKGFSIHAPENKVYFLNGLAAAVDTNASYNVLKVYAPVAPNGGAGPVSIVVNGDSAVGPVYTYSRAVPVPFIVNVIYDQVMQITGGNFDSLGSVVTIGGVAAGGFSYRANDGSGNQVLRNPTYRPPAGLDNPVNITVTVSGQTSNAFSYLFYPSITGFSRDTAFGGQPVTINGNLFGSRAVPSSVRAYYLDAGFNVIYMTPDPAVVSWSTGAITVTMPIYTTYPTGRPLLRYQIYLEVDVSTKNTSQELLYQQ